MSKRWYVSKLIGAGTRLDMLRPKAYDLAVAGGGSIIVASSGARVAGDWAFCLVDVPSHTALLADPDIRDLPDTALDAKMSTIPTATRNKLQNTLTEIGLSSSLVRGTDGYRIVIKAVGRHFEGAFDENAFDVKTP